jgi:hypothetical protein
MVMGACQAGGLTPTPALILTLTPVATPGAGIQESSPNSITLVSNPLGDKITFRATVALPSIVKIRIHDHFYAPVTILQKKGTGCFDVLWKVQKVPDGIYYYDSEIKDAKSGSTIKLPMQKVIVTQ